MSSTLPADAGTATPALPRSPARDTPRPRRDDYLRLRDFNARVARGEDESRAWERVIRNPKYGLSAWKCARSVPPNVVQRTLIRFYLRMGALERELTNAVIHRKAASVAPRVFDSIVDIADGKFGEGKVTVRGRGDDAEEIIEIDGQAARARLAACRDVLEIVGAIPLRGSSSSVKVENTNVAQAAAQSGLNVSLGAAVRALRHLDVEAAAGDAPPAAE